MKEDKPVGVSLFLCIMGVLVLCVDAITKYWVNAHLPEMNHFFLEYPYGGIPVFRNFLGIEFSISHATNKGAAWGILSNYQLLLLGFRIVLVAGLLAFLFFFNRCKAIVFPLVLVAFGAIANVIDYFIYGHVVDMFKFVLWGYHFPIFNVADICISLGVAWLLLLSFFGKMEHSPPLTPPNR